MNRSSLWPGFVLIALALASSFALSPAARAVCEEGCDITHHNTFLGDSALFFNTTGFGNTAIGFSALARNTTGNNNTANGVGALVLNTTGVANTAIGSSALARNTTGFGNTANGLDALFENTTGDNNTANGVFALFSNTIGGSNTANGFQALLSNTTGFNNTANGVNALYSNITGNFNTANGFNALFSNIAANHNTANGFEALFSNTTGEENTANGDSALLSNTDGSDNTAIGFQTLFSNTTGTNNIAIGVRAGVSLTTGDNNIDIGNAGVAAESNTIRIGRQGTQSATYIAGISGTPITGGVAVRVNANGQLGSVGSSVRFKQNIKPMDKMSEAIHALKPVSFRYKQELDPDGTPQFGLVAEDVAEVNPDLVARDAKGEVYTVRYEAVNAMLLNEFLKEHRKVEQLKNYFESKLAQQQKQIEALTAGLQKVSAQIELDKAAPQMVGNDR
jgi:trimeric autotransporter adhesin